MKDDDLLISLTVGKDWKGVLKFDTPRFKTIMIMPFDWPRINQFPEWFTAEENRSYELIDILNEGEQTLIGGQLKNGVPLSLLKGATQFIFKK